MSPNLTAKYNTGDSEHNRWVVDHIAKQAGLLGNGISLSGMTASLGLGKMHSAHIAQQEEEAQLLNEQFQAYQHERLSGVNSSLHHSRAPVIMPKEMAQYYPVGMDEGMVRMASAIGSDIAQIEKNAGWLSGVSKALPSMFKSGPKVKGFGAGKILGSSRSSVELVQAPKMPTPKLAPTGSMATKPTGPMTMGANTPTMSMQTPGHVTPPATNVNTSSGGAPAAKTPWLQRTGLFDAQGNFRKYRTMAAAGALGAGYLGIKALQRGMDYMGRESPPANYGTGGPQMAMSVNQFGQPQFGG